MTKVAPLNAWLKACVRVGTGPPHAPLDVLCDPTCANPVGASNETVMWDCLGSISYTESSADLGLVSAGSCKRVGEDHWKTEGFWQVSQAQTIRWAAVCCEPAP